ncbi:MAG: hypothetical protein H0V17_04010 [Deltaproteobacteria bacterium]|nr:hypothetical protein [Deltaproteobacteria bacterium]
MRLALLALAALDKVDDSLYDRFVANRASKEDPDTAAVSLYDLWNDTFRTPLLLLAYCRKLDNARIKKRPTSVMTALDPDAEVEDEDELGDLEGLMVVEDEELVLGADDIGDLVAGLGNEPKRSDAERWHDAIEKIGGIRYALAGQTDDATERMEVAIGSGHANHVLGLLDEMTSTWNEGIHALVMAVYEAFVPDADPGSVVPAYKTTLRRALMVRRAIAGLFAELAPINDVLQAAERKRHAEALVELSNKLHNFVLSDFCRSMRAADRWELTQFDQRLEAEELSAAKLTAEGLVKYLESLGVVNQREVLVEHDRRVVVEVREALTVGRELAELSARTAHEIIVKACEQAQALLGRATHLDALLKRLRAAAQASKPAQNTQLLEWLDEVLAATGL